MSDVTVVIPVERGREWPRDRATSLPAGTPYIVAEHDPGDWRNAVNDGVKAAKTDLVIVSHPDAWFDRRPEAVTFLADMCEGVDVTWGPLVVHREGKPVGVACEGTFCPVRVKNENYINAIACFRRDAFLSADGVTSGPWDLYARMADRKMRFKYVPEGTTARDDIWVDPSPEPEKVEVPASFYHQATPGTTYWRCTLPARHLPAQVLFSIPGFAEKDGEKVTNHQGTAIFQYAGDRTHFMIMKRMQQDGHRVLIEVDDDYTHWHKRVMRDAGWHEKISDPPYKLMNGGMSTGGGVGYSVEMHRQICEHADGVTLTTEYVAGHYRKLNENVYVCPNQIDPADWPEPEKPDDGIFRIGWFASGSHRGDAELILRSLDWASRQKDVEVVLIGLGVTNGKPWYKFPYKHVPWSNDFGVYKRFLGQLDVGLAPVVGTPWAQCRSDLKALEYGAAGAYPIVSDQPPYNTVDVPKAKTAADFHKQVRWMVQNRDEARTLAKEWREHVLAHRTVEGNIDTWRTAIGVN